jgi:hypothetical protein
MFRDFGHHQVAYVSTFTVVSLLLSPYIGQFFTFAINHTVLRANVPYIKLF